MILQVSTISYNDLGVFVVGFASLIFLPWLQHLRKRFLPTWSVAFKKRAEQNGAPHAQRRVLQHVSRKKNAGEPGSFLMFVVFGDEEVL